MLSKFRICVGALLLALSACTPPPPAPTTVQLAVVGAANMNNGAPTKVKVYYLSSAAAFQTTDFFAVFGAPEETLGADLIAVDEYQLSPGKTVTDLKSLSTPPAAIGVVAAFRDVDGTFLAVKPLVPNALNPVQVTLTGNSVAIQ